MNLTPEENKKIRANCLLACEAAKNLNNFIKVGSLTSPELLEALKNFGKGIKNRPLLSPEAVDQLLKLDKNYENK